MSLNFQLAVFNRTSMIWPKHIETYIGSHIWDIYDGICDHMAKKFPYNVIIFPELPRTLRGKFCAEKDASKWVYFCMEMLRKWGQILRKKLKHGNEFISVRKFCGNEGNWGKIMRKKLRHGNELISMWTFCGNVRKYRSNFFREFHRILTCKSQLSKYWVIKVKKCWVI